MRREPAVKKHLESLRRRYAVKTRSALMRSADEHVLRLLRASRSLAAAYRERFPLVVVDELQDTSDADWELVQVLAESALLRCYGDPNQAVGMTTLEAAQARMQAAIDFGCVVNDMTGGSHRDRSAERVLTALAEAVRDSGLRIACSRRR